MSRLQLSRRERNIAVVFIIVIFAAGVYRLAYVPFKNKSDQVSMKISAGRKNVHKNLIMVQKAKNYEEQYKSLLANFQQKGSDDQMMSATITEI